MQNLNSAFSLSYCQDSRDADDHRPQKKRRIESCSTVASAASGVFHNQLEEQRTDYLKVLPEEIKQKHLGSYLNFENLIALQRVNKANAGTVDAIMAKRAKDYGYKGDINSIDDVKIFLTELKNEIKKLHQINVLPAELIVKNKQGVLVWDATLENLVKLNSSNLISIFSNSEIYNYPHTVSYLLKIKDNFDKEEINEYKGTPLLNAIVQGKRIEVIQLLIAHNIGLNERSDKGETALHCAITSFPGSFEYLFSIFKDQINVEDKEGNTLLHLIAKNSNLQGHEEKIAELIINHPNINLSVSSDENIKTPICEAASEGNLSIIKKLHDRHVSLDERARNGSTPLLFAAQNGHDHVVDFLIKNKADVNARSHSSCNALYYVIENEKTNTLQKQEVINLLLGNNIALNVRNGVHVLHVAACYCKNKETLNILVNLPGIELNIRNNQGNTPISLAAVHGNLTLLKLLVEKGVSPHEENDFRLRPIHDAALKSHVDVVEYLLEISSGEILKWELLSLFMLLSNLVDVQKKLEIVDRIINCIKKNSFTDTFKEILYQAVRLYRDPEILELIFDNPALI